MKAHLETETKTYVRCINCGGGRYQVDHLVERIRESSEYIEPKGSFTCEECGRGHNVKALSSDNIQVEMTDDISIPCYDLLVIEPQKHPIYLILKATDYNRNKHGIYDGKEYYYNEHTCPTNWTDEIVAIVNEGNDDPHGIATYVRSEDIQKVPGENEDWREIFPEIFEEISNTKQIELKTNPWENKELVEKWAIKLAIGNNGGEWATHYYEKHKEYWRQFVIELFKEVNSIFNS